MRIAVLVSGRGSNLGALLEAEERGALAPAEISLVLSNRPQAPALERAREAGRTAVCVDQTRYRGRVAMEEAMLEQLTRHRIDAIVLAGFMRILSARFLASFSERVINVHPSLLPAFPGLDAAAQAIAHGAKVSGCTVHFVDDGVDTGPIIAQACTPVHAGDDAASLHRRIQTLEHELLPRAVQMLADGRLSCIGRRVDIRPLDGT